MPAIFALTSRNRALRAAFAAVAALGLAGCQSIQSTSPSSAGVRFVAASSDAPGLDFLLNKTVQTYNLGYNSYTPNYLYVSPGTYTVAAAQYGYDTTALASANLTVKTSGRYTVIAGNPSATLALTALTDLSGPAPSGSVSIRLVDMSASAGALDIYMVSSSGTLLTTNALYTNLTLGSNTGYINVPAGTYQLEILPNGTVPISTTITSYTGSQTVLTAGAVRTIIIDDNTLVTTPPLQVITLNDYD
ncbi:MAG: DUF4397 domain-containing protein [Acidobacteriaceae bacterium]|nr:DUF4397 domain-containing protein [Acidobacteriaceae bacterium]